MASWNSLLGIELHARDRVDFLANFVQERLIKGQVLAMAETTAREDYRKVVRPVRISIPQIACHQHRRRIQVTVHSVA